VAAHGFDVAQTVDELRAQLDEVRQLLSAIRTGEVDALVVPGPRGDQVYSLTGAEHPYRVLVEAMSEGAVILADDGTIVYSNPGFAALVRAPVDEVIGSALDRFVAADDLRSYRTVVDAAGSGAAKGEIRLAGKDGATVPVHLSISAFESMAPRSVCAVVTNLSEQKRHEELISAEKVERARRAEAEAARQRVQSVLESITDSYFAIDREWRITDANERAAANYGMTRDELVGKTFWDLSRSNIVTILSSNLKLTIGCSGFLPRVSITSGAGFAHRMGILGFSFRAGLAFHFSLRLVARDGLDDLVLYVETRTG